MPGEDAVSLTKDVYHKYEYYLSIDLNGENWEHFQNAVSFQMQAIEELKGSTDAFGYLYYMNKANEEYNKISL